MFEILINKNQGMKEIGLIENGKLVEYYIDEPNANRKEGNIYVGIVKDVVKGMQAAFVDIGTEKNGFIHLKDMLPKIDETKESIEKLPDIKDVAKVGQRVLVQVKKDSNRQKGARVSTHINIPGKYVALMPNTNIITVSQKIEDKKEQERLKQLVRDNLSEGNGAVIRTSAKGKSNEIIEDLKCVEAKWKKIEKVYKNHVKDEPLLLKKAENIFEKMLMDLPENNVYRIVTNNKNQYDKIIKYKNENTGLEKVSVELQNGDVFELYSAEKEKVLNRKIWLKCGGFITIDKTEALTAIDVNTGKYTGTNSIDKTIYKVNKEATIEIAKQLRLKDIGGIIIIDYIDMSNLEDKAKIEELLKSELKKDRAKTQVEGFTRLELMEMTRKHICMHEE